MLPWQEKASASNIQDHKTRNWQATPVGSVLTRFSQNNEVFEGGKSSESWIEKIEIEVDSDSEFEVEDPDKGLMESLMEHIEKNAVKTKNIINSEVDALILSLNERRKELLLQVDAEREQKLNRLRNKRRKYARSFCREPEIPSQYNRCRSTDDINLETARDTRMIENLRPLQCGDLKVSFDSQIYESLKQFGKIEDSLASGLHSEAIGLGLDYSFVGEEASFKIITKSNTMNKTFSDDDKISVQIRGPNDQIVTALINTKNNGMHTVTYRPTSIGHHRVHVFINKFELLESPFSSETFSKEDLAFELDDPLFALQNHVEDWVLNKEETSALLETNNQSGALIFGAKSFNRGKHGWRIKFTSACAGVTISIGVSLKTRIVEIDTRHTHNFKIDSANTRQPMRRQRAQRKLSTFHRQTRSFFVILDMDEGLLTIICCETEERHDLNIPKEAKHLYPCVYMVHECAKNVCPRPVVAFS